MNALLQFVSRVATSGDQRSKDRQLYEIKQLQETIGQLKRELTSKDRQLEEFDKEIRQLIDEADFMRKQNDDKERMLQVEISDWKLRLHKAEEAKAKLEFDLEQQTNQTEQLEKSNAELKELLMIDS